MGRIVEMVDLRCGCKSCGKIWKDYSEMRNDDSVTSDLDYDTFIYFHECDK